jgi:hypothetical protein
MNRTGRGIGCWDKLLPWPTKGAAKPLLKAARLGAGAEPLPRGSLLAAAPAAAIAAGGAAFVLLFEGAAAFLFKSH